MSNIVRITRAMPPKLADQVKRLNRHPDPAFADFPAPDIAHDPEAAEWLRRKRELVRQASREDCHDWLVLLSHGINGVAEDLLERRELAIWSMCRDLPDLVWCEETMQAMWKRTSFLPTPGECRELLEAHAAPLLAEIEALERIAHVPPPKPQTIAPPYQPPPAPIWNQSRFIDRKALVDPHPPVRTVEEQIAALKAAPDPPQAAD